MVSLEIKAIVELLNNMLFLASAYNQIWTVRVVEANGKTTVAFVDERSDEVKVLFTNPDKKMQAAIDEIISRGWFDIKSELIAETAFSGSRVHLCEKDCTCHCHNT